MQVVAQPVGVANGDRLSGAHGKDVRCIDTPGLRQLDGFFWNRVFLLGQALGHLNEHIGDAFVGSDDQDCVELLLPVVHGAAWVASHIDGSHCGYASFDGTRTGLADRHGDSNHKPER
jgi:hypothetical protein